MARPWQPVAPGEPRHVRPGTFAPVADPDEPDDPDDPEVVELVSRLIRNRCVNDGSGRGELEQPNLDALLSVLDAPGIELDLVETTPGRSAAFATIAGHDPAAPTLLYLIHPDVSRPAQADRWSSDPFGGEISDGMLWGRGAVHGLSQAATIAMAVRRLADAGFSPNGTLTVAVLPDRFDLDGAGTRWVLEHEPERLRATWAISDPGGHPTPCPAGTAVAVPTSGKGTATFRVIVDDDGGWSSMPSGTTAASRSAEVVQRLEGYRAPAVVSDRFRAMVGSLGFGELLAPLLDPHQIDQALSTLPAPVTAFLGALTHPTIAVTGLRAHRPPLLAPDRVEVDLEVGVLPGADERDAEATVRAALDDVLDQVELRLVGFEPATSSPADTRLVDELGAVARRWYPDAVPVPVLAPTPTRSTVLLRNHGVDAYGAGAYSSRIPVPELAGLAVSVDEHLDLESIAMMAELWEVLAGRLLGS